MDTNGLRGAALALTGVAAHIAEETAARVAEWVDGKFADDEEDGGRAR